MIISDAPDPHFKGREASRPIVVTSSAAEKNFLADPRSALHHMIFAGCGRHGIFAGRSTPTKIVRPAVFHPLPDIAGKVDPSVRRDISLGFKSIHVHRLGIARAARATGFKTVGRVFAARLFATV